MEFFKKLEELLHVEKPAQKCEDFKVFYQEYLNDKYTFNHNQTSMEFEKPSYFSHCIQESKDLVIKRKKLGGDEGKAIFLHTIAHIEYSAIDLAIDAAYRFKNMPKDFYDDWLSVAADEVKHFGLLEERLKEVNSFYGQYPVHFGLFKASQNTQILHERMAVVPRYLEANGLDATPIMIEKLSSVKDIKAKNIIKTLELILEEECDHVLKGDRWFKYACDEKNLDYEIYFEIIEKYYPGSFPRKKGLNIQARQVAGFSCKELKKMDNEANCD